MSVNSVRAKWKGWVRADFISLATGEEMKVYGIGFHDIALLTQFGKCGGGGVEKRGRVSNRSMRCSSMNFR